MDGIYEPNESFDFDKISLLSPVNIPGGNYFIKFRINDSPLYIQPPKCKTKQSFIKSGKKIYCDLLFSNEHEKYILWMEKLEEYCQKKLFENRTKWFDIELDEHDIENSFTSPLKLYKSGKYYTSRTNVPTQLDICSLKVYNEDEQEINIEDIKENTEVMTILEIQGIKCSTKNFQVEIELKQMMMLKQNNIFEKCLLKTSYRDDIQKPIHLLETTPNIVQEYDSGEPDPTITEPPPDPEPTPIMQSLIVNETEMEPKQDNDIQDKIKPDNKNPPIIQNNETSDILEIDFDLENVTETSDTIHIKKRNYIYFEMYKEAKRKAKIAKDLAISSYLEAKHIKNTYLLEDFEDSESDLEEAFYENELK